MLDPILELYRCVDRDDAGDLATALGDRHRTTLLHLAQDLGEFPPRLVHWIGSRHDPEYL